MLKKRIIPVQLLIDNRLVKTIKFDSYRDVGDPVTSSKIYSDSDADELILLNISRNIRTIDPVASLIKNISKGCFMPLSVGGGIKSLNDASTLIRNGADKIVINSAVYKDPTIIKKIYENFGKQAVVISIDVKKNNKDSSYTLYSDCGRVAELVSLEEHIDRCIDQGAGEILINSIDLDGTKLGYDIDLIKRVKNYAKIPVIGCGGAGNFEHMRDAFLKSNVSALACGTLFNFGDNNPIRAKAFLKNYDIPFKRI